MSKKENVNEELVENEVKENNETKTVEMGTEDSIAKVEKVEEATKIIDEPEEVKEKKEDINKLDENPSIGKRIFASILDQAILFGLSAIVVVLFALIIKLFGYYIAFPVPMLLIAYVVLNILYLPVFEKNKGRSIGKRILGIL
ncbi:RDD family protein [uncultured Clostridium sp.]|uniref:RDD family protein n=1 Tax=uncultured Clostridium sp. TaxID=59620 RepID=UPI0026329A01|nr:RDD family protein [uncultured Clostridium sp.]